MKAMLFTEVRSTDEATVQSLLDDPRYCLQQKFDGVRVLAHVTNDGGFWPSVRFAQRGGEPVKFAAAAQHLPRLEVALKGALQWLLKLDQTIVLDGELMIENGHYHVFDSPYAIRHTTGTPYEQRLRWAQGAVSCLDDEELSFAATYRGPKGKRRAFEALRDAGAEGVMFKDLEAVYEPGRHVKHSVKVKFVRSADVVVTGVNRPDARHGSASLGVFDSSGQLVPVGSTSLIGKPHVEVGDVIELAYLYWTGSSVYQPRMVRVRPDKAAEQCTSDQFTVYSRKAVRA